MLYNLEYKADHFEFIQHNTKNEDACEYDIRSYKEHMTQHRRCRNTDATKE